MLFFHTDLLIVLLFIYIYFYLLLLLSLYILYLLLIIIFFLEWNFIYYKKLLALKIRRGSYCLLRFCILLIIRWSFIRRFDLISRSCFRTFDHLLFLFWLLRIVRQTRHLRFKPFQIYTLDGSSQFWLFFNLL